MSDDASKQPDTRILFPYFQSNGETGIFLAVSDDGMRFADANDGKPIITPPQWSAYEPAQNLMRDPSIVYHDGVFHLVWTSNWRGEIFGYASSKNLRDWSAPKPIRPFKTGDEETSRERPDNIWAPEIDYDPVRDDFIIIFSATFVSERNDGDGSEDPHGGDHRLYFIRTKDFDTFTEPAMLFDPGVSTIDADLHFDDRGTEPREDDRWIMVYKREVGAERGGKNIRIAFRDPAWAQPWEFIEEPIAGLGSHVRPTELAEGPTLIRDAALTGGQWLLYWDCYANGHYAVARSNDLKTWEDITDRMKTPPAHRHPRHGSPFIAPMDAVAVPMPRENE